MVSIPGHYKSGTGSCTKDVDLGTQNNWMLCIRNSYQVVDVSPVGYCSILQICIISNTRLEADVKIERMMQPPNSSGTEVLSVWREDPIRYTKSRSIGLGVSELQRSYGCGTWGTRCSTS